MAELFLNKGTTVYSILLFIFCSLQHFSQSLPFNQLTTSDGLSNNTVYNIIQDKSGFLWFTTDDGLNRFDGYQFKVFRNDQKDQNSISDNTTMAITEDYEGNIWIGTKNGIINCYDPVFNRFKKWDIKSTDEKDNPINVIHIDDNKYVWVGTYRSGLYRLNPETGEIKNWHNDPNDNNSLSNNYISAIVEDEKNNLWIGTFYGLNKFNPEESEKHFTRFFNSPDNTSSLSANTIWAITSSCLENKILYIGTINGLTILNTETEQLNSIAISNPDNLMFGTGTGSVIEEIVNGERILWIYSYAGLLRYNLSRNTLDRFTANKESQSGLLSNQIYSIYKDNSGVLWIGTNNGINFFSQKNIKFNNKLKYSKERFNTAPISKCDVKAIAKTQDGTIWFGTENGFYFTSGTVGKKTIKKHPSLASDNIWCLTPGRENELWIGTYGSGLYLLNYKTNKIIKKAIVDNVIKSPSKNFVKSLYKDRKNRLWIGYWGIGLASLDLVSGKVKNWLNDSNDEYSLSYDDVWDIFEDSKGRIWIGTNGGGLNCFNETTNKFFRINLSNASKFKLSSNSVYSITESTYNSDESKSVILWIGTNSGLNKLILDYPTDEHSSSFIIRSINVYTIQNGLADNSIKSIVEDDSGNLWLGTSSGITFFNTKNNSVINFSKEDGIDGVDINSESVLRVDGNFILIGSTSGLNTFNPSEIIQSSYKPKLVISDFQIFNSSISPSANSVLTKNIFFTDDITLSHKQNVFSFEFSAFDYNSPHSIKYAYRMEGFDKDWVESGSRRYVTYTNLNPGKYTFKVRSTNSDGVWCDNVKSIAITITPPWWQTGWAILLYFIVFITGVWGIIKFQAYRASIQQELKTREFESYHLREVEQMKSRFFANLSHEFRTPLLLIKGPLESLLNGKIRDNIPVYYKMLLRNTEKLQQLIDQLLELSQLEAETIPLKVDSYNIVDVIKACFNNLQPLAEERSINFVFSAEKDSVYAMIDKDKLEKIINNLLSNAFKFTPSGGSIYVNINCPDNNADQITVSVKDTGIGIPNEFQNKIFDRFYQIDNSSKRNFGGSGIGLALVKELATLHNWEINLNSVEGEGTEFVLTIPIKSNHSAVSEKLKANIETQATEHIDPLSPEHFSTASGNINEKSLILFVEDNEDVRVYVNDLLKSDYDLLLADCGESGIEITKNNLPDLILSDVMMPGMDGFEFCRRIKSDWKTSHIPVILLTAKVDHQSKLDGLELGADDYITKPFEQNELLVRIKNLIEQRRLLKEKFSRDITLPTETVPYNKEEKELIEKASSIVEKYLNDENFNSEILAKEMFMSRSRLTRKMQSAAGQGPGEFIRNYKLNRSARLILEKKLSITQIAFEVGFGSPAQFTRAFQKHFNCLPSEFNQMKP
ncbi:MAG: two-component regulator propeller domain-containing protein [Ignavibacterium sp.]|jgi:signal transduction histidine kinase/ligand-binding sensor domain-containing protein/DNA-binding response OmpR family regulator|nr:two-component regulator propeller domain-containing protein [Ignavibacterium sp.]